MILGAALTYGGTYLYTGGSPLPYDLNHKQLAEGFICRDATWGKELKVSHLKTKDAKFSPFSPQDIAFTPRTQYRISSWEYDSESDPDVYLTIWGPGNDGVTYLCEFSKSAGNEIQILGWGFNATFAQGSEAGYASTSVRLK